MSEHFCTYFDHRYAAKGLAMWESLKSHCSPAILHVFCLNDACCDILANLRLPDVHLHSLKELEDADPELGRARSNRSLVEYYFTLTPCLPLQIFRTHPEVSRITYVDADLFFCADPQPVLDEVEILLDDQISTRLDERRRREQAAGQCGSHSLGDGFRERARQVAGSEAGAKTVRVGLEPLARVSMAGVHDGGSGQQS
jgi:hypothetical protein